MALGDSFTIGTGSSPDRSFPARLRERLPQSTLLNLGVNGFRAADVIERQLAAAAAFGPDFATLAVGANDIVRGNDEGTYRAEVRTILTTLSKSLKPCRIVVLPQPAWSESTVGRTLGAPEVLATRIARYNEILREEAIAAGARTLDLTPLMRRQAGAQMLAPDGLHPSAAAYEEWAEAIVRALETQPLC